MKTLLFAFTLTLAPIGWASPPPHQEEQDEQHCRTNCHPPRPQVYTCHARMVDCYGRPLYTYWARGPQYQGACHYAADLCLREARMGYGGPGARCHILGK